MVYYGNAFPKEGAGRDSFGSAVSSFEPDANSGSRRRRKRAPLVDEEGKRIPPDADPFDRAVALCVQRDRSSKELRDRLAKLGYELQDVESAVERARECGLVNDERFADAFIRGRSSMGKGAKSIARDLSSKHGICLEDLRLDDPDTMSLLDEETQVAQAVDLLCRRPPKAKDAWAAAYRKLVGRGYSPTVASRAVRMWSEAGREEL